MQYGLLVWKATREIGTRQKNITSTAAPSKPSTISFISTRISMENLANPKDLFVKKSQFHQRSSGKRTRLAPRRKYV